MSKAFVDSDISLDRYISGRNARRGNPLGGGPAIHQRMFRTATFQERVGSSAGGERSHDDLVGHVFARAGARGKDVRIGGGAETRRQYLHAGVVDEITLHIAPVLLGTGVRLFDGVGPRRFTLEHAEASHSPLATHITYRVIR